MNLKRRYFFLFLLLPLFLNTSCTTLSKNMVKSGELKVIGGVHDNLRWEDQLIFKRYSWYRELTLYFDVGLARLGKQSSFWNWFSRKERKLLETCDDFYVALNYKLDTGLITERMFLNEMEKSGYDRTYIPNFESNFRLHPDASKLSTDAYKVYALCKKRPQKHGSSRAINFPGFSGIVFE